MFNRHQQWGENQALTRLPMKRKSPADLITYARRFYLTHRLKAPWLIKNDQARRLAEEFVLYNYCVNKEN